MTFLCCFKSCVQFPARRGSFSAICWRQRTLGKEPLLAGNVSAVPYLNTLTVCHWPSLTGMEERSTAGPEPSSNLQSDMKHQYLSEQKEASIEWRIFLTRRDAYCACQIRKKLPKIDNTTSLKTDLNSSNPSLKPIAKWSLLYKESRNLSWLTS